jgi:hypothetical protein
VITGERVSFQLEKGVSIGEFFFHFAYFYFVCLLLMF